MKKKASDRQEGGNHYKDMKIEPAWFCYVNRLNSIASNIVKYACRYDKKGTPEADIKKIIHYAELLLEYRETEKDL